jgi:integrase
MRRTDVNLVAATWTNSVNKSDRPHVVPLPPWSRELIGAALAAAKGTYLFPSPVGDTTAETATAIEAHALATALRRVQRPLDANGKPAKRTNASKWVFDFRDPNGHPSPISPHDLRRTCSSHLELPGFGDFVRGSILNHSQRRNVTAKHYSATDFLKLKRTALLRWGAACARSRRARIRLPRALEDDRAEEARVLGQASI